MYSPDKIEDLIEMKGRVRLELLRVDGSVQIVEVDNLVVDGGKGVIADRMKAAPAYGPMTHLGVGTGGVAPAGANTTLNAELARVALTNTAVAGAVITYTATFGPGVGTGAIVEAGLFAAAAAGAMLTRTVFAVINKAAGDTLNVTWTVTVG